MSKPARALCSKQVQRGARKQGLRKPDETAARRPARQFRLHARWIAAIWAVALLAYSNSFQAGLVFDNVSVIGRDTRIREASADNLKLILSQDYWYGRADTHTYRPLTTLSYLVNYAVLGSGPKPVSYHWVNFAIHAVNCLLVYLLGLVLLQDPPFACAMAAIWAVQPVLTEAVTNIVGRADLLAGFGVLAGLLCHIQATKTTGRRKLAWLAGLAAAAGVGICSKENGIVVLAAMALYDLIFRPGSGWRPRLYGYLAAGVPIAGYLAARGSVIARQATVFTAFTDNPLAGTDFWTAHLTAVQVLVRYAGLLLWPLHLSCDYSYNQIPLSGWGDWRALASLAMCAGAFAAAIACWRRAKAASYFILFYFASLAPTANLLFPTGTIMAERFLYLPAVALAGGVILAWRAAGRRWTRIHSSSRMVMVLVCAALAVRTWARNSDWLDNVSLWSSAVAAAPHSYKAHEDLAVAMRGDPANREQVRRESDASLAILNPLPDERNAAEAYATAARSYREEGDALPVPSEKFAWYRKALDTLQRGLRIDQARSRRLGREAATEGVYLELGRIYERLSQPRQAVAILESGRRLTAGDEICEELASLYQASGEFERAAVTYLEALSLNPDRTAIAGKLIALYRRMDPQGCSLANGTLNLECPLVRSDVCASARNVTKLYRDGGKEAAAETVRTQAMRNFGCGLDSFGAAAAVH